jgi:hypothetical protein
MDNAGPGVKLFSGDGQRRMDEWREQVDEIEQLGKGLTNWELQFIESISDQLTGGRPLTERQAEVLDKIYTEKCP